VTESQNVAQAGFELFDPPPPASLVLKPGRSKERRENRKEGKYE
jgi:hypothetical protein